MNCICISISDQIRYVDEGATCLITGALLPLIATGEHRVSIMQKPDGELYARVFISDKIFYNTKMEYIHEDRHPER